jgi:hypothetical protein
MLRSAHSVRQGGVLPIPCVHRPFLLGPIECIPGLALGSAFDAGQGRGFVMQKMKHSMSRLFLASHAGVDAVLHRLKYLTPFVVCLRRVVSSTTYTHCPGNRLCATMFICM